MSTRGWQGVTYSELAKMQAKAVGLKESKPSKYRNVKTTIDGQVFDSKREADVWIGLKAREQAGEIHALQRQVAFSLHCVGFDHDKPVPICEYRADFLYLDTQQVPHVVDAKGVRTAIYRLKKKWMALEHGIEIEEV